MKNKITLWLADRRYFIEALLVTLSLVALLINWLGVAGNESVLMLTMSILAGFYFISSYFVADVKEKLGLIVVRVIGIGSAVCLNGILFFILKMEGSAQMLMVGASAMAVAFLLSVGFLIWSQNRLYFPFAIRAFVFGGLAAWIFVANFPFPQ
jgi:hypothetical protein